MQIRNTGKIRFKELKKKSRSDPDQNFFGSCSNLDPNEHEKQDPDPDPDKVGSYPQHCSQLESPDFFEYVTYLVFLIFPL